MTLTLDDVDRTIAGLWSQELVPRLEEYIAIPALSPAFDPDWAGAGHIERAADLIEGWIRSRPVKGMTVSRQVLDGRTPLVVAQIDAFGPEAAGSGGATTVLYGHLDKQPEMVGWRDGLAPWTPVLEGTRLYGRGGADDGYAAFASLAAIEAVQRSGGSHPRLLVLIEASEESGSPDLPAHVEALAADLGRVDLVICLDSGCASYDTLWLTTSLRGVVNGSLTVDIVTEGIHSGASGVVPSTFRILRTLLDRVERAADGAVTIASANVEIPPHRIAEAKATAELLGDGVSGDGVSGHGVSGHGVSGHGVSGHGVSGSGGPGNRVAEQFPFVPGARPMVDDPVDALLAKTWKPALSYIGLDGMPPSRSAGNVLRPSTTLTLSLRIPPTADHRAVLDELRTTLEADPPYGASVRLDRTEAAPGWNAPDLAPWLREALDAASNDSFGRSMQLYGEGGTIPFMGMLGERFPAAQFVITGVLGPGSNAHGPNEFLDVAYAEKLTACLARVLDRSCRRP